jgi:hypothetical protein|tara:strand:+ start:934 stop:1281 length:348 start_codon:yes stop_codon:yes gene_type:complete
MSDREIMNSKQLDEDYNSKEVVFRDPVVERVVDRFIERSDVGYAKYGTTLHEERTTKMKDLLKYLNDVQEELMDAVLYLQTAKEDIIDKKSDYTYPEFVDKFYNDDDDDDEKDIF